MNEPEFVTVDWAKLNAFIAAVNEFAGPRGGSLRLTITFHEMVASMDNVFPMAAAAWIPEEEL